MLSDLKVSLDEFETALEQGFAGRISRAAATAELVTLADEVVQIVKMMNGLIRIRFANRPDLLGAWEVATNVVATPRPEVPVGQPPAPGGDVRPAA